MKKSNNQYTVNVLQEVGYYGTFHKCIQLNKPATTGQVINEYFILPNIFTNQIEKFNKGNYAVAVPLDQVAVCETPFDLTEYGFIRTNNKWIHPDRCSLAALLFESIESKQTKFHTPTLEELKFFMED